MLKNFTTVKKVAWGFALLTLVLVAAVSLTLWQVAQTQAVTLKLVNQSSPMVESSLRVINGVNTAVAQARGWMLLDDEKFKTGWAAAYSEGIDPSLANLKKLAEQSGNTSQQEQVRLVEAKLKELKAGQEQQIAIVRTEKQLPAHELMQSQAGPKADEITTTITAMIDEEGKLEATAERKLLLYQFASFRGSFGRTVASLREYLATGKDAARRRYQEASQINVKAISAIDDREALFMGTESQQWAKVKSARAEFDVLAASILEIRQSDKWDAAVTILRDKVVPLGRDIQGTLLKLIADLEPLNKANRDSLVSMTAFLTTMEWVLLAIGIALSGTLATLIIRNVRTSIADVQATTQEVRTASHEIATGAQQQVTSLNQTATSLNEITTTAEEFKATMQEFADRARAVQEAANETAKQSAEGRTLTQESATRIAQVRTNSQAAGESVLKLADQMQRIGEITATVNEIADQTKLLALNASIEAARAGEEGRGFAVVATQVRELANQSKQAAGRIEALISGTQKSMQDVVQKIESGSRLSEESTEIVRRMTTSFEEIAQAIQQTTSAMGQINTGAKQQEMGISELVSSITEIDSASKESLASAEQTRKSIMAIDEQIKRLDQTMTTF